MSHFQGFPKQLVKFFEDLKKNNNKEWFETQRQNYENHVKEPARAFVVEMGKRLRTIAPDINAVPKVNQSLFRINRDTRFSKDKSPYKTNLGIWFWEGRRKRMECSGFYFHFEEGKIMLGTGMRIFSPEYLKKYREAVVNKSNGPKLVEAVNKVSKQGYIIGVKYYKRVPHNYDADHERAVFLMHNGLTAMVDEKVSKDFFSSSILDYAFSHFKNMSPIHQWLRTALG